MSDLSQATLYCPECGLAYDGHEMFCTVDGSALGSQPSGQVARSRRGSSSAHPRWGAFAGAWLWVCALIVAVGLAAVFIPGMVNQGIIVDVVLEKGFGLQAGDNVYVAGYKAGEVTDMWPEGPGFVARVRIQSEVRDYLWSNCVFYVTPEHILHERRCICVFLPGHVPSTAITSGQRVRGVGELTDLIRYVWLQQIPEIAWEVRKLMQ